MIRVSQLSDHHAHQTRDFTGRDSETIEALLLAFVESHIRWRIHEEKMTPEERLMCFKADLNARLIRALRGGLSVEFWGERYALVDCSLTSELLQALEMVEKAIVDCGKPVEIVYDDERGLKIATGGQV